MAKVCANIRGTTIKKSTSVKFMDSPGLTNNAISAKMSFLPSSKTQKSFRLFRRDKNARSRRELRKETTVTTIAKRTLMKTKMKLEKSANCLQKIGQRAVKWSETSMSGIRGVAAAGASRTSARFQVVSGTKHRDSAFGGTSIISIPRMLMPIPWLIIPISLKTCRQCLREVSSAKI